MDVVNVFNFADFADFGRRQVRVSSILKAPSAFVGLNLHMIIFCTLKYYSDRILNRRYLPSSGMARR